MQVLEPAQNRDVEDPIQGTTETSLPVDETIEKKEKTIVERASFGGSMVLSL